ncbi:PaaI family thioesterase [Caldimonas thermodepolymerans]|uniref:PaaI family thioesterase n=1 Tax=Caldimonas thermodepolymerans TaxID=215580 RepID=UPI00223575A5|nr:PaaI family thioesterase [Caldimonas thermodepolymerans]UZG44392.1 PaaI family thioesterase [Caldimonas thermodepolymerans]
MPAETKVPPGYVPAPLDEGFLHLVGPLFSKRTPDGHHVIAFRAGAQHLNRYGVVHGGMLAVLADVAVGMNMSRVTPQFEAMVTVNLSMDYLGSAHEGAWIEATPVLTKTGGRVRFGRCDLHADGVLVASAHATFYKRAG